MSGTFCIEFVFKNMEILPNPTESLNNREIIVTIFVIKKFRMNAFKINSNMEEFLLTRQFFFVVKLLVICDKL